MQVAIDSTNDISSTTANASTTATTMASEAPVSSAFVDYRTGYRLFQSNCFFETAAFVALARVLIVNNNGWLSLIALVYLLIRFYFSDFGRRALKTLPRDLMGIVLLVRINWRLRWAMRSNAPIHSHFLATVGRHPDKECAVEVESGRRMTFRQLNDHANKYANRLASDGHRKDDVVALFLENGIEFLAAWLGCSKIGVVTAWINTNLKLESLIHSVKASNCKTIITSKTLLPKLKDAVDNGLLDDRELRFFIADDDTADESFNRQLSDATEPPPVDGVNFHSVLCYIYTSGTTGHPKAAIICHYRYFLMSTASSFAFGVSDRDRIYVALPMYHSAGGILGIGHVVVNGATAVIRTKFSASNFWRDCIRFDCTASQYIGEICRYLLAQKPSAEERAHNVRVMYGNGLRPQIWGEFVRRFGIRRVGELYGSTEGNSNILNLDNHEGSCGFIPIYPFLKAIYPVRLVKVDEETGELVRDPRTGLCIACRPGDTGEMVGMIRASDPILRFEGYVNGEETSKKIIRHVMRHGDQVFFSGDILYWDRLGYLYFKDRRGDTFRWKGENCATTEVEGVVQPVQSVVDAAVYGVEVPYCEGRAGMIAISLTDDTEVETLLLDLAKRLSDNLAAYAVPVFLRVCQHVDRTGTFKLKKNDLQKDGFDPVKCNGDSLYYWNAMGRAYAPLDDKILASIRDGTYTRL